MYDVYGGTDMEEKQVNHLEGYVRSQPVRTGNGAHTQLQLDVYGEVADAAAEYASHGGRFDAESARLLTDLGKAVCSSWMLPDAGIWEIRAEPQQHTHSKVLCWTTLVRLIGLHEAGHLHIKHVEAFRSTAATIRSEIECRGFNENLRSYTQVFGGSNIDASLLVLPHFGFLPADHPRMQSTYDRIIEQLGASGLVYRYRGDDGLPPGEGAFGVCGFWAVECRARAGDHDGAARDFDRLLGYANDLGLFAEEIDPDTREHLGNFPQAFTHIGLINAALTLLEPKPCRDLEPSSMRQEETA
jgi:GH15 family glucan-1,4-alpha-glucosidase